MESLQDEIHFLREGEENLQSIGRTLNVDKHVFNKLDLVYIKVFDDLPYFRKAAKMFFERLAVRYEGTSHLMILRHDDGLDRDRKSTRLNSSHVSISYAVFCLKKKNNQLHKERMTH